MDDQKDPDKKLVIGGPNTAGFSTAAKQLRLQRQPHRRPQPLLDLSDPESESAMLVGANKFRTSVF